MEKQFRDKSYAAEPDRGMLTIVTGAYGFLGREIMTQLRERGCRVRGLAHTVKPDIPVPEGADIITGDLLDPGSLDPLFAGIKPQSSVIIHTAGRISMRKRDALCERVNYLGTLNLIRACKRNGVRRFIYVSSVDALTPDGDDQAVKEPERFDVSRSRTSYSRSKAAASQLVLDSASEEMGCTVLLPSAIIGPGDYNRGFITRLIGLYLSGCPRISISGGYEFVDVRDAASAAITASQKSAGASCYILSSEYASFRRILDILAAYAGRKPSMINVPLWALDIAAPLVEAGCLVMHREPLMTAGAVGIIRSRPVYDHNKASLELGFFPCPIEQSVVDTAEFVLAQLNKSCPA